MRYEIIFAPQAKNDLSDLKATVRSAVRHAIAAHLRHEPTKVTKSRIKRLRGMVQPQFRLRVRDVRVFYDVTGSNVEILAIVKKSAAQVWLRKAGKRDEGSPSV